MLALLLLAPALFSRGAAEKLYCALADQVDHARFICIGRVEEIVHVRVSPTLEGEASPLGLEYVPIARVAVERVLKGPKERTVVHHEVWRTWACDTTGAKVGERALLLLAGGLVEDAPEAVREAVHRALQSDFLLRNVGSGDGILEIAAAGGEEFVRCSGAPRALGFERVPQAERLVDVIAYIEELARFSLDSVSVHGRSEVPPISSGDGSFDLRILPDGRARLARRLGVAEQVSAFQIEKAAWEELVEELGVLTAGQQRMAGDPSQHHLVRKLSIRTGAAMLSFAEPRDWSPPSDGKVEQHFAIADALQAWRLVCASIDCPGRDDHAEKDRDWLRRLR